MDEKRLLQILADSLVKTLGPPPTVAVVLGSGWNERAAGLLSDPRVVPLSHFPDWPRPRVEGHAADLHCGELDGVRTLLCGGRVHAYEGYEAREIVRGVRALVAWGVPNLLLLNAAGSLDLERPPGGLMPLSDHLNLGLPNPLHAGQTVDTALTFTSLVGLYDEAWRAALLTRLGLPAGGGADVRPGVYAGLTGPTYETPAEVCMLAGLGADAVGMSTIPEAIAAHAAGARVCAISLLTNYAAGLGGSDPDHLEVLDTASAHGERAAEVLRAAVLAAPLE